MKDAVEKDYVTKEGYIAVVRLNHLGFRCGYVGIPKSHLLYGKNYSDINLDVHGGLTYSGENRNYPIPNKNVWWFGFDAGHAGDGFDFEALEKLCESEEELQKVNILRSMCIYDGVIKDADYMVNECNKLSEQLKEYE